MKRILCVLLVLLLLCGCAGEPAAPETAASESTAETAEPVPTTAEAPAEALVGPEALTADTVLFYRQADFKARQGTLLPLETVLTAPKEARMPRTHWYDDLFPEEAGLWLRLLDYALANGWQGFAVPAGTLPEVNTTQRRAMEFMYRIDYGKVLTVDRDGVTTVWYNCAKNDTMEKFTEGLAAARRIAAEAPRGDDWETLRWIFDYFKENVVYGDRTPYYFTDGHLIYDALVQNTCLCSGYSDAMYYLCSLCGVECLGVTGLANDPETAGGLGGHAWDLARLNGTWCCFDPTFFVSAPSAPYPLFFGLSTDVLQVISGNKLTDEYTDETLVPGCGTCFDPVSAWSTSPEGALRSWLWFGAYDAFDPSYLLMYAGLMTKETGVTPSADGTRADLDIPWADYAAWAGRFLGEDAQGLFPVVFFEGEDGKLAARKTETDSGIDWSGLQIRSVSGADGVYTADLGALTLTFTVSQTEEGLYRVETVEQTSN